jgi:hypothetical protein
VGAGFIMPDFVGIVTHLKVIVFYGAETTFPLFTLFTAAGIAKIAFGIPAWTAVILMAGVVFGYGLFAYKTGIFGKDLDIKWQNTKSAKELSERLERIEGIIIRREKIDE